MVNKTMSKISMNETNKNEIYKNKINNNLANGITDDKKNKYTEACVSNSKIDETKTDELDTEINISKIEKLIRDFENTSYFGYMFFIEYDGKRFNSFDENPNMKSVKSEFRKLLEKNGIKIFKGIQQAGRTDRDVSAKENILYINSQYYFEFSHMKYIESEELKIKKIVRTIPFLEFPQMICKRFYIYECPMEFIKNSDEKIKINCEKLSGKKNFKKFTSKKGEKLKNHIREIFVRYKNGKLHFEGDGFLPQQVRIMSNFILNGQLKSLPGEYLTLERVEISEELEKLLFEKIDIDSFKKNNNFCLKVENNIGNANTKENLYCDKAWNNEIRNIFEKIEKIEKNHYFYVFYVKRKNKGEIIGKNGKNIRKMKKVFGNIVIKEENQIF